MTIPAPSPAPFDFESHRRVARESYQQVRALYADFAQAIRSILIQAVQAAGISVASVEARAKSTESFSDKASTQSEADPNRPKYPEPLKDITDLAGARVIGFFPGTVEAVEAVIRAQFRVLERSDKGDTLRQQDKFGYQSVHYLISLTDARTALPEYARYLGLVAEVQVRTILQHAWAEIEHDIQYKSEETIPPGIRRRFLALAGVFEMADREFEAIQREDAELRRSARERVEHGNLESVEITADALRAYLDRRLGADGRMTSYSYDWTARLLLRFGFSNLGEVDRLIDGLDDDRVSRVVWGSRMGQLTRFEGLLLARLGEAFINNHPWQSEEWFTTGTTARLNALRAAGIAR